METIKTNSMFMIDRTEQLDRSIIKKDFIRYAPSTLTQINSPNAIIRIDVPREDTIINLDDSYLELELQVVKNADDTVYADNDAVSLVNFGHVGIFTEMTLTTSDKKHRKS
jgi:hypothetical protein